MRMVASSFREKFHAANTWHAKIGNYHIKVLTPQGDDGFFTVSCGHTVKSWSAQEERKKFKGREFIVDSQYTRGGSAFLGDRGNEALSFRWQSLVGTRRVGHSLTLLQHPRSGLLNAVSALVPHVHPLPPRMHN